MNFKHKFLSVRSGLFILTFLFSTLLSSGQTTPLYPLSYRIFNPFIFNPAIAGSKDFLSADLIAGKYGKSNSQIISGSTRLSKSSPGYFSSRGSPEFTNIGIGGSLFNELNGSTRNNGISAAISYHLQADKNALSFLSFGVSGKAVYSQYSGNPELRDSARNTIYFSFDAGVYYYGENLFAGLSVTNIPGNPEEPDSMRVYTIPVSQQLFFQVGYKIALSKSLNILLEPSIIVNTDLSFSGEITDMIEPMLKIYAGSFCAGTYFYDFKKYSFFLQYKYPKFYIGTYFELPKNTPFYKSPIRAELAFGLNISAIKSGFSRNNHW